VRRSNGTPLKDPDRPRRRHRSAFHSAHIPPNATVHAGDIDETGHIHRVGVDPRKESSIFGEVEQASTVVSAIQIEPSGATASACGPLSIQSSNPPS